MKKEKGSLKRDRVESKGFHVGIELELCAPLLNGESEHDYEACYEAHRDYMSELSESTILTDWLGLSSDEARRAAPHFDRDQWVNDYMSGWSCDDSDCPYITGRCEDTREQIKNDLKDLTGNTSFKVVSDRSIDVGDGEVDAEVCWNYYASKETILDNAKILKYLADKGCSFDTSRGLHINLNNYLYIDASHTISVPDLDFLFNFVAPSRRESQYCTEGGLDATKYSMIFNQGDRLEFRFFSPTLDPVKLNHYVTLANVIYRRLAGKDAKLPRKTADYLRDKMVKVNKLTIEVAESTIAKVNSMRSAASYHVVQDDPRQLELTELVVATQDAIDRSAETDFDAVILF